MTPDASERRQFRKLVMALVAVSLLLLGAAAIQPQGEAPENTLAYYVNQAGGEKALAAQGQYLAKAGNCHTCHTAENGPSYAGGLPFVTDFGVLYSTNITPDENSGIGTWSFDDFYQAMKHGVRPTGEHLYPAFPYTDFALLTEADVAALFVYVQSLTPVATPAVENKLDFPYSQRAMLGVWKMLFHDAQEFIADGRQSEAWNRGAYLVEGLGHCGACHSPRNRLGAEKESLALTGGAHMDKVRKDQYRTWSAVNLTSDASGLSGWSEQDLVDYLLTGISDKAVVHGPMTEVVMNSTRYLTETDAKAMAVYLKSLPANKAQQKSPAEAEILAEGEVVYTVHCGSCHLPTGLGSEGMGVSLVGNAIVQAPGPESLINVILYGPHLPGPPFSVDRSNMKMFGKRLSDNDIAAIASYLRGSFGHSAAAVTPAQVKAQR